MNDPRVSISQDNYQNIKERVTHTEDSKDVKNTEELSRNSYPSIRSASELTGSIFHTERALPHTGEDAHAPRGGRVPECAHPQLSTSDEPNKQFFDMASRNTLLSEIVSRI